MINFTFNSKKAQAETSKGAAILVLLIAIFTILYLLLLPPAEREAILGENFTKNITGPGIIEAKNLLVESPGELSPLKKFSEVRELNPVNLFVKTEPVTMILADSLVITKTILTKTSQDITFTIEDISNIKSASLFFTVKEAKGILNIKLNKNNIFSDELTDGIKIVKLPVDYLQEGNNLITIEVSSPGLKFWSTNKYSLENIGVKETFERINPKEERIFTISSTEKNNLEKMRLYYLLYCNSLEGENTRFRIFLNDQEIHSSVISCVAGSRSVDIPVQYINTGQNKLTFIIEEGDYLISQIKIESQLKEKSFALYHFNIDTEDYQGIIAGKRNAKLTLNFEGAGTKKARIFVNTNEFTINTAEMSFSRDISKLVNSGDNIIRIIPDTIFTVNILKISLE